MRMSLSKLSNKTISLMVAIVMLASIVLPMSALATIPVVQSITADGTNGTNGMADAGDTITVAFDINTNAASITPDTDIIISDGGTFGAGSSAAWSDAKTLAITLGTGASVNMNSTITINDGIIADANTPTDFIHGDYSITAGNFGASTLATAFTATAICSNLNSLNGKSDKIVLVWNGATNGANLMSLLTLSAGSFGASTGEWNTEKSIYTITLINANITSGAAITFTNNGTVKDTIDAPIKNISSISVTGDLVGAGSLVTASSFTATIVKGSAKPTAQQNDKVVLVFNAPTNQGNILNVLGTSFGTGATGLWNPDGTVFTIKLGTNATVTDSTRLTYTKNNGLKNASGTVDVENINNVALKGSFGTAVAPKALKAYAVDVNGTANTVGDKIKILFDTPTNATTITSTQLNSNLLSGGAGASLGSDSTATWTANNTVLEITLGSTAVVANGFGINLSGLGIKDEYSLIDATIITLPIAGSFGTSLAPRITKAIAVTTGGQDVIRVFFNTLVKIKGITLDVLVKDKNTGVQLNRGTGSTVSWTNSGISYCDITLGSGHGGLTSGQYSVTFEGTLVDDESGKNELIDANAIVYGAFAVAVTPEVLSVTAISQDGSGVAKAGDSIYVVFNVGVSGGTVTTDGNFGSGYTTSFTDSAQNVMKITLGGANLNIIPGSSHITLNGFKDISTETATIALNTQSVVGGSFGYEITPAVLSVTAISQDGSGKSKQGDKIFVVFNTPVKGGDVTTNQSFGDSGVTKVMDSSSTILTITLGAGTTIGQPTTLNITGYTTVATGKALITAPVALGGSFGYSSSLLPISATIYRDDITSKDSIRVIFNQAVDTGSLIPSFTDTLKQKNQKVGNVQSAAFESDYVLKIVLNNDYSITSSDSIDLSGLGIKSLNSGADLSSTSVPVTGTMYPLVKEATASGNTITITFSNRTNGVANISGLTSLFGVGATATWSDNNTTLIITLGTDFTITDNGYIVLNGMGIKDGFSNSYSVVGQYKITGSFTYNKVILKNIIAQSPVKTKTIAGVGDNIIIKFATATNMNGKTINATLTSADVDAIVAVNGGNTKLGTGYIGTWTSYDTFKITLGIDPTVVVGDNITISNIAFPNGQGAMDATAKALAGSFDGREFAISNGSISYIGANNTGDFRVKFDVTNSQINTAVTPTIVCVAYNGNTPVAINRLTIYVSDSATAIFDLSKSLNITQVKVYVFDEQFADIASSPNVFANTVVITK